MGVPSDPRAPAAHNLVGVIRDDTGVMIEPPHHSEGDNVDIRRPTSDAEFAASVARIARAVIEAGFDRRKPPFAHPSVVEYGGFHGYPRFCQIAHRKHQDRVQFALIHMPHGGSSPKKMFETLATHFRQHFYPKVDPVLIDWFDVVAPDTYDTAPFHGKLIIDPVTLQQANGIYRNPTWHSGDNLPPDWIDFVARVIAGSRKSAPTSKPPLTSSGTHKKRGCTIATAFVGLLSFQRLLCSNLRRSTATSPGVTCLDLAGAPAPFASGTPV